jgi:hypothetical protein
VKRSFLFFALIAAATAASSVATAGWSGCGWCGGCGSPFYARGLVACDAHPFYVVNHGPVYSGPAILTYPAYTPRAYPYVYGGCYHGFGGCYGISYVRPIVSYRHHRPMYRIKRHYPLPLK